MLVVDDNVDSAEMLREMLQLAGHEVAIAHDGPSALEVADAFAPDIALLDIGLPVMDGYELGKRLHARPQTAKCRLIALSGYGQERDRAQSRGGGVRGTPREARRRCRSLAARRGRFRAASGKVG